MLGQTHLGYSMRILAKLCSGGRPLFLAGALAILGCVSNGGGGDGEVVVDGFVPTESLQELGEDGEEPKTEVRNSTGKSSFYLSSRIVRNLHPLVRDAQERLKSNPYDLESFKILAYRELMEGNPDGVVVRLHQVETRMDDEAYVMLGIAYLSLGKEDLGFRAFDKAAAKNPNNMLVDLNRGVYLLEHGAVPAARGILRRVAERNPKSTVARFQLGRAEYLLKDYENAIGNLKEATNGFYERDVARYTLGLVYQVGLRDYAKAHEMFSSVADDPHASSAMRGLAGGALKDLDQDFNGVGSETVFDKK